MLLLAGRQAGAVEKSVVILLEGRQWPYERALAGLVEDCGCVSEVLYLESGPEAARLNQQVADLHPALLVAVGTKALHFVLAGDFGVPVVYAMVLNPWSIAGAVGERVIGVSMNIAPAVYWQAMDGIKPAISTIGMVYNPANTAPLKELAEELARHREQRLLSRSATNPTEALQAINEMASQVNAFWMIPDPTLIRQEVVDTLVAASIKHKFVLIGLSARYVEAGALLAYSFNSQAIGQSAGNLVKIMLNGQVPVDRQPGWAPEAELTINLKTAEKIRVVIDPALVNKAVTIIK